MKQEIMELHRISLRLRKDLENLRDAISTFNHTVKQIELFADRLSETMRILWPKPRSGETGNTKSGSRDVGKSLDGSLPTLHQKEDIETCIEEINSNFRKDNKVEIKYWAETLVDTLS